MLHGAVQTANSGVGMASVCPGSPALPHARAQVQVHVQASCSAVRSEMLARVTSATWIDPHNNGTYVIEDQSSSDRLDISRMSGGACRDCYTDRLAFTFADEGELDVSGDPSTPAAAVVAGAACVLSGCSDSQAHRFIQSTLTVTLTLTLNLTLNPKPNPNSYPYPNPNSDPDPTP